ncbi:energy-coupling factor transporter transmembrane component T [Nocardioides sp. CFH 31398]|uniref:energy-coupling factor transporter transmembrane component T n=1 Tax=Nocardioides sp. CFH 31398 TaxID=2919579 RepID=UPI001F0629E5|nr:energy-coupling factor transporter transmembrane component T [Nocardioides sp. CFH 31398]MCH1867340.1 energy-coupling factor transporter transmembrane protein EcfT [Nocardioides sp. CFH 31398]
MSDLLGLHRPGTTVLHRLGAGTKLLGLIVLGVVVVVVSGPVTALPLVVGAAAVLAWTAGGVRPVWRALRGVLLLVVLLGAWLAWAQGWERAVERMGDVATLVLLATVLTTTTPIDAMLDAITRGLRPLRRLGVSPEAVALAFSLMLRGVPATLDLARETRDAARARGLERNLRALLVPLALRTVANARATGQALHARGVGDD